MLNQLLFLNLKKTPFLQFIGMRKRRRKMMYLKQLTLKYQREPLNKRMTKLAMINLYNPFQP